MRLTQAEGGILLQLAGSVSRAWSGQLGAPVDLGNISGELSHEPGPDDVPDAKEERRMDGLGPKVDRREGRILDDVAEVGREGLERVEGESWKRLEGDRRHVAGVARWTD
jgi:hypothetical protein